jgi:hypothetical protein
MYARFLKRFHFFSGCSLTAGNDCARVAHAPSWRCCLSGNEGNDWFRHVCFGKGSGLFFRGAANFTNHHYPVCLIVGLEKSQRINVRSANNRIAANADCG